MGSLRFHVSADGIVISSVLGSVAAEGAEGTTGGEASDDSSITVVQIGQNGEYLGTARLPAQTEGTCYTEPITGEAAGPRKVSSENENLGGKDALLLVLVVGGQSNRGQLVKEAGGFSQKSDISSSQSNVVTSSTTRVNKTPTYRKVVVQETREIH
ncbi:hypothetical protein NQZ68_025723 [Dissostichus eleginoides]|nr:hypothetical protein NQZ68_025723 [Dissostichus eleginoides]